MRNGMHVAFGSIALSFVVALEAVGQFDAPPQQPPQQPAPREQAEAVPQASVVATVNGEAITRTELQGQMQSVLRARQQQAGEPSQPTPQELQQVQQEVLATLVEARLIEQFVREQGPEVQADEIEGVLGRFQQGLQGQGVTLDQYLASNQQTVEDFRKRIESSLAWQKYQQEQMSPEKLREFYEDQRQRFGEATFEQVQPQVTRLYVARIWNDIVEQMKPEAKIQVAQPQSRAPETSPPRPVEPQR